MSTKTVPVYKGQEIELAIDTISHDGEGIGRYEGFTVFVPGSAPGDTIRAHVVSVQKNYARALLQAVINCSPSRVAPLCEHYDECGGCQLQHIAYDEQLVLKHKQVENVLQRIGGLDITVHPVIGMPDPWRYRNKAQVPVGMDGKALRAGFYEKRSHRIVDVTCCAIQHPVNDLVVRTVRQALEDLRITAYNEQEHRGLVRHILARTSFTTGEVLVVLVINGTSIPRQSELTDKLRNAIDTLCGIVININTRRGNTILGDKEKTIWGVPYLTENLGGLRFRVSPRSFFQVNPAQTERLYAKAKEYAALTGTETVFDLYCGIGTISLYLALSAAKVVGVEYVEDAVRDARKNAELNGITNTEFFTGAAEVVVPRLYKDGYSADVVVVDPPRKGCDERLLHTIAAIRPERIVYVSCNPATLARDLKYLGANGFEAKEAQPVDMFPHTSHVETVVLITRVKE